VYRQQILYEFLASAFPANVGAQDREKINGNWLRMIPALPESTIALETSMLAVSTAKLGRLNDNQVLIHESLRLYVQGLWELQKALWDPKLMHNNETLAACMALIVYEVVECPDKTLDGWVSHMRGCAKMFELKGPGAYDSDFGHQLFLSFRVIEVFPSFPFMPWHSNFISQIQQALAERRNTFLASPDWMSLPFKNRPKSTFQQLLDSVVKVPNIIADGYQMLQAPLEGTASLDPSAMVLFILGLVDRCWKVDAQLSEFYATLEKETLGPVYWPELSNDFDVVDTEAQLGKVFPVAFKFLDMRMAHICLIYCMSSLGHFISFLVEPFVLKLKCLSGFQSNSTFAIFSSDQTLILQFEQGPRIASCGLEWHTHINFFSAYPQRQL
jgi:hypothetical protein